MSESLLPCQTSEFEQALDEAGRRISKVPVTISQIWDPWRCPAHFLPWLADGLSVDSWDSLWPEHIQRQVIADSVPNHRIKGTVGAIKRSLSSLNASVELQEWWQTGGVPHSAELLALAHENLDPQGNTLLTPKLQAQLWQTVAATKPCRSQIQFSVGVMQQSSLALGAGADAVSAQTGQWHQHYDFTFSPSSTHLACVAQSLSVATPVMHQAIDMQLAEAIWVASAIATTQFQQVVMTTV
ncbi:phage tail protein I [Pseudoalteromonas sp. OOF1S-7]|uniref:phage tail protein I n=1 Tax=Pseudoalteromonas sp. OOF1S-7 TaxID=2917757 RepID=UPI001EF544CC|nr:phage tail protein I [Pseudoalteromonas sp. OOF1S-7]MCG7536503.1 phage tail protein I [Pseudoalteromonas sp. OOF1S-7]